MLKIDKHRLQMLKVQLPYTFKDEKAICTFLGVAYKRNATEREQLIYGKGENSFGRYAKVEKVKDSRARVVTEVYDEPLPYENKRSPYKQNLETVLLHRFAEYMKPNMGIRKLVVSWEALAEYTYMANSRFFKWKSWRDTARLPSDLPDGLVEVYRMGVWAQMKRFLDTAMRSLQKDGYLKYNDTIVWEYEFWRGGELISRDHYLATEEEKARYQEIFDATVRSFTKTIKVTREGFGKPKDTEIDVECETFSDILRKGKTTEFYERLNDAISDEFGALKWIKCCEVIISPKLVEYALSEQRNKAIRKAAHSGYVLNGDLEKRFAPMSEAQLKWGHIVTVKKEWGTTKDLVYFKPGHSEYLAHELIALGIQDYDLNSEKQLASQFECKPLTLSHDPYVSQIVQDALLKMFSA